MDCTDNRQISTAAETEASNDATVRSVVLVAATSVAAPQLSSPTQVTAAGGRSTGMSSGGARSSLDKSDMISPKGNRGDSVSDNPLSNGDAPFDTSTLFAKMQEQADSQGLFNRLDNVPFCMEILTYAISPLNIERLVWDAAVLGMVFYSTFSEPYSAAFFSDPGDADHLFWNTFGQVVDLLFWVDILANFFTGFDRGFEIVLDKPAIVMNYCFGWGWFGWWFWIDLVATIDWVWVASSIGSNNADAPIIRMMRLLKVLRLARASRESTLHHYRCPIYLLVDLGSRDYIWGASHCANCFLAHRSHQPSNCNPFCAYRLYRGAEVFYVRGYCGALASLFLLPLARSYGVRTRQSHGGRWFQYAGRLHAGLAPLFLLHAGIVAPGLQH